MHQAHVRTVRIQEAEILAGKMRQLDGSIGKDGKTNNTHVCVCLYTYVCGALRMLWFWFGISVPFGSLRIGAALFVNCVHLFIGLILGFHGHLLFS
jgi:hypothetical protein